MTPEIFMELRKIYTKYFQDSYATKQKAFRVPEILMQLSNRHSKFFRVSCATKQNTLKRLPRFLIN